MEQDETSREEDATFPSINEISSKTTGLVVFIVPRSINKLMLFCQADIEAKSSQHLQYAEPDASRCELVGQRSGNGDQGGSISSILTDLPPAANRPVGISSVGGSGPRQKLPFKRTCPRRLPKDDASYSSVEENGSKSSTYRAVSSCFRQLTTLRMQYNVLISLRVMNGR